MAKKPTTSPFAAALAKAKAARAKARGRVKSAKKRIPFDGLFPRAARASKSALPTEMRIIPDNKLFPGRDNYTGPQRGWFAMLHHEQLFEPCENRDVQERVDYVKSEKPQHERAVRLRNMMYLGEMPEIKALQLMRQAMAAVVCTPYETRRPIEQAIDAVKRHMRKDVIAYVASHYPDHAWDERNNTIKGT